ncbi:MAG: MarR family winged helix-turn-helix transcriptional regulator [Pseudonocardiaceae bacterium]
MAASHERTRQGADPSGVSVISIGASAGADGAVEGVVTVEDVDWLVAHLRVVVTASPAVWTGRGMTLAQVSALHFISALAPVTLTDLALALGTSAPATWAMVDRLAHAGLVRRTPDPRDRRRVLLTLTADAEPIVGGTDPDTARHLQAVLNTMSPQTHHHLIDILIDTIRRSVK